MYNLFPPSVYKQSLMLATTNREGLYCESVSVKSSEIVAQIVGKQGAKIKMLHEKSRTIIQTPVYGKDPTFIISGKMENVLSIKTEILNAADHFTAIKAGRDEKVAHILKAPGSRQIFFFVPSYLVGLIVGKNGENIRKVQFETNTYIKTPKKTETPIFKITGQRYNVFNAVAKIVSYANSKTKMEFHHRNRNDVEVSMVLSSSV